MQFPIHLIFGILIQLTINSFIPITSILNPIFIIIFAFSSHFILDAIAKATYHPPERINNRFWLYWHLFTYGIGFLITLLFVWQYFLGMLFANATDIWDWLFLRREAKRRNDPNWGKKYYLHPIADKIRATFFFWLPNLNYNQKGILPETLFIIFWLFSIILYPSLYF